MALVGDLLPQTLGSLVPVLPVIYGLLWTKGMIRAVCDAPEFLAESFGVTSGFHLHYPGESLRISEEWPIHPVEGPPDQGNRGLSNRVLLLFAVPFCRRGS